MKHNFDKVVNRRGTFSTQWDYIEDRFGEKDLLPFSISDTDFEIPQVVYEDLKKCLNHRVFGYTRWNHEVFKGAIAHHFESRMMTTLKEDWIVYSPSVVYSISALLRLKSNPKDGILVFDPMYDAFINVIEKNDRTLISCPLQVDNHFSIDFALFEEQLKKSKIFLLCSPHNPTGRVFKQEELAKMIALCKEYNVFIISDEIHSDVILFNHKHLPILKFYKEYANMALVSSASKTFNTPGLGGSYAVLPDESIRDEFLVQTKAKDSVNSANVMGMYALISAYTKADSYIDELISYVETNMKIVEGFIKKELPDVNFVCPQSTYLAWIDIRKVPFTSEQVQKALVKVGKVGIMRGEVYGKNGSRFLRMNVGCTKEKLEEGLRRMKLSFDALYRGEIC